MAARNRRLIRGFSFGVTAAAMMSCFHATPGFAAVLVDQGKPNAAIIVSGDAPDSVQRAASELQSYVEKVTGAKLPIQKEPIAQGMPGINVFLGESSFTKALGLNLDGLKSDGFKIVSKDNWLAIMGRDYRGKPISGIRNPWNIGEVYSDKLKIGAFGETGTLFGVYRFLEDYCGVRWYMPGDLGTVIPKMETIKVEPIDCQKSPDFEYRYPWFCDFPQSDDDALWYRHAGFGAAYPAQIIDSFSFFLKYKDTHPDYFALIGGKRDFTNLSCVGGGGNLCLSNPDVAKQWVADINEYFDKNPEQFIYPLMPNDGENKICECAQCQAQIDLSAAKEGGKFSNYTWDFVNKVAKEVYKTHPDKLIGCCAYNNYCQPPTNIKKLSPNVAVMICKQRAMYADKEEQERTNKLIAAWREKTDNIYAWEYYDIWSTTGGWTGLPVVFPHIIADDLKSLKGISRGEFIEDGSWTPGNPSIITYPGMQHLNLYVTARLMWDSSLDVDKLMNEYYAKFYGPAEEEMKGFWTAAEGAWMTPRPPGEEKNDDWRNPINLFPKDRLDELASYLEKARLKTPENSVYQKRIELIAAEFLPAKRRMSNVLVLNPPEITVAGPAAAMQINGAFNDSAWKKIAPMLFVDRDGEEAKYRTLAYTAWDDDYLYFAFINYEPEISKLTALETKQDPADASIWEDDCVEIFICPNPADRAKCYQFIVNAKGVTWNGIREPDHAVNGEWKSGFDAKTKIEANRWILEVKIPFKAMGIATPAGKTVAANFYRNRHCGQPVVYSSWAPTLSDDHFTPARFGQITFKWMGIKSE